MKHLSVLFAALILISHPVFSQETGWSQNSGSYGTINGFYNYTTNAYASCGEKCGVFGFWGTSEYNGLASWFLTGNFSKNFSYQTPVSVLLDVMPVVLTGSNTNDISVTLSVRVSNNPVPFPVVQHFSLADAGVWKTIKLDFDPSQFSGTTIDLIDLQITTVSGSYAGVEARVAVDCLRLQYDYQGDIVLIDRFGDTTTDVQGETGEVSSYQLFQNYPNPFNPATTVKYAVANSGHVSLKIYNILGHEIMTLIDEEKSAGEYEVLFDASALASGTYFYRLDSGGRTFIRKMIFLK